MAAILENAGTDCRIRLASNSGTATDLYDLKDVVHLSEPLLLHESNRNDITSSRVPGRQPDRAWPTGSTLIVLIRYLETLTLGQVRNSEESHQHTKRLTCKKDVGGACFRLIPPADVAVAELSPAAELARVRRGGVDKGQLAIALVLLHAVSKGKAGSQPGQGPRSPHSPLPCSRRDNPAGSWQTVLSQMARTTKSLLGGTVFVGEGSRQREKLLLKGSK